MKPHLSPSVATDSFIFLSGQLPFDANGQILDADCTEQTRQVLANLEAVLREHGLDRTAIIKTTIWITDAAFFPEFNESYGRFFGEHKPARSTVVSALALPGAKVEIEAIATR